MNKIFITGGAGFIASHLVDYCIKKGNKVIAYDNLQSGKIENVNSKAQFIKGDICDFDQLKNAMQGCNIVYHLAAIPRVLYSIEHLDETHNTNVNGSINVLRAAHEHNIKKVIFASSSAVCGNTQNFPTREEEPHNPLSPYAVQKATIELYMQALAPLWNMDLTAVRFFNVYGTRCDPDSPYSLVIAKFIKMIQNKEKIQIYGDGNQERDFTNVADAVAGMYACKELKGYNVINIGNGQPVSVNDIVNLLKQRLGNFEYEHIPAKPGEARKTHADRTKALMKLGWEPKVNIEQGVDELILSSELPKKKV